MIAMIVWGGSNHHDSCSCSSTCCSCSYSYSCSCSLLVVAVAVAVAGVAIQATAMMDNNSCGSNNHCVVKS